MMRLFWKDSSMPIQTMESNRNPGLGSERSTDSPYILFGDVFRVHRQHFPGAFEDYVKPRDEPGDWDDCLIVQPKMIDHYHFNGQEQWANYSEIQKAYKEYNSSHKTHNSP
jgi:hypothetical protein